MFTIYCIHKFQGGVGVFQKLILTDMGGFKMAQNLLTSLMNNPLHGNVLIWMDGNLEYGLVLFGMGWVDGWLVFVIQLTVSKGSFKKTKQNCGKSPQYGGGFWSESNLKHVFFFFF